jgi:hypothetical protein
VDGLDDYHDFFVASAGVAGALIGLLFVALSVAREPADKGDRYAHRFRGASALTSFLNALTISLFLLVPDIDAGWPVLVVGLIGFGFLLRSIRELHAARRSHRPSWQDVSALLGLAVVFGFQIDSAAQLLSDEHDPGPIETVAFLVIISYIIGISRAWEMIGGPRMSWRDQD